MPANDDTENENDALEGLALLEQQNPYAGAPIHSEVITFRVRETSSESLMN